MTKLQAGGNIALGQQQAIDVCIHWLPEQVELDVCAFVLGAGQKVRSDADFIFYNQPAAAEKFISLTTAAGQVQQFSLALPKIPAGVEKIIFAVTSNESLTKVFTLDIEVKGLASFSPELEKMQALILGELYLHQQQWKFRAIGQGFTEGLAALAAHYGVNIDSNAPEQQPGTELVSGTTEQLPQPVPPMSTEIDRPLQPPSHPKHGMLEKSVVMVRELSWKWTFSSLGVFVLLELFFAGFLGKFVAGRLVPNILTLQIELIFMLISFFIGGAIIGLISPKIRILEPALAAFFSVMLTLSVSFFSPYAFMTFSWTKVFVGGGIAFLLALFGAHCGEKLSAKLGNKASKEFFADEEV